MKLRVQILLLVCVPLIALGGITYTVGAERISQAMADNIENGLHATAIAVRDSINLGGDGDFWIDENGEMWKGNTLNISKKTELADNVKEATGMEVTVFFGDTRYMTSVQNEAGERVIGTKASDKVVDGVIKNGNNYFAEHVDVAGEEFFAYYIPIYNASSDLPVGMVFAGISQEDAEAIIHSIIYTLLGIILATTVLFVLLALVISNGIVKSVKTGVKAVEAVADGDLTITLDRKFLERKDEIGEMAAAIAKLKNDMINLIGEIAEKSGEVHSEARLLSEKSGNTSEMVVQVERAVTDIANGAGAQAEETQTATENIVLMGKMIEETDNEVGSLKESSKQIKESGDEAAETLKRLNDINAKVTEAVALIYEQTNTTNESALKIKEATDMITSIAEETNLLSLNASIEAARAGEQGRGFAIVAGQIQKLAEQSDGSAKQIEAITNALIHDSEEAVATMNEIQEIIKEQNLKVSQTDQTFSKVKAGIEDSIASIQLIAEKTHGLDEARIKIVDGVQNLSAIAEENAASTEETSASVTEVTTIFDDISESADGLRIIADDLKLSIEQFKL